MKNSFPFVILNPIYRVKNLLHIVLFFFICSCNSCHKKKNGNDNPPHTNNKSHEIIFNADSAYSFIQAQVDFGPRAMNTKGHYECGKYLGSKLRSYAPKVLIQEAVIRTPYGSKKLNIKNFIASFNPENPNRIMLCAHWDTRPWADMDSVSENKSKPIPGADDGASGVGILLEIARLLARDSSRVLGIGVDIIFFDAEDYGQSGYDDSYCLGSQYWSRNLHVKDYYPRFGILLDMTGAEDAEFVREYISEFYANDVVDKVWKAAAELGYEKYFVNRKENSSITDDHFYINTIAHIKTIDIINRRENGMFAPHWHTLRDNMNVIDKNTLKAVGQTLIEIILREEGGGA